MLHRISCTLILATTGFAGAASAQDSTKSPQPPAGGQVIQTNSIQAASDRAKNLPPGRDAKGVESTASVKDRFELASDALASVSAIISNVNQVLGFTAMEQSLGAGTNPWSDEKFRNGYDKMESWITPISLLLAGASALLPATQRNQNASATFLSVGGIAKLLGARFGQQTGEKFEQKASAVEFSRRAYDDLRNRYATTNEYIQSNKALLTDLEAYRAGTYSTAGKGTDEDKKRALVSAGSFLTRLDLVMTQIPAMLQLYESTIRRYCPQAIEQANRDPNNLGGLECRSQLPGQAAPFILVGEAKMYILQAANQLFELRANQRAADQVRTLTPSLRGALAGQ